MTPIHVRQIIAEQTLFDKGYEGKVSEGILIKQDGTAYIQSTDKSLTPLKNEQVAFISYKDSERLE